MYRSSPSIVIATVLIACVPTGPARAGVIDTTASWDGSSYVYPWGSPGVNNDTPTYGETFSPTAASGNTLTSMLFEIETTNNAPVPFQAYVYAWGGTNTTGPALFTSTIQTVPNASGFQAISVAVPNLALTVGTEYIAMFSTEGLTGTGTANWGLTATDTAYTGGTFMYNNGTSGTGDFGNASMWNNGQVSMVNKDLAFTLAFSSNVNVPEPSSLVLLGLGAGGLLLPLFRDRKAPASED